MFDPFSSLRTLPRTGRFCPLFFSPNQWKHPQRPLSPQLRDTGLKSYCVDFGRRLDSSPWALQPLRWTQVGRLLVAQMLLHHSLRFIITWNPNQSPFNDSRWMDILISSIFFFHVQTAQVDGKLTQHPIICTYLASTISSYINNFKGFRGL